jgi:hypothetical protein
MVIHKITGIVKEYYPSNVHSLSNFKFQFTKNIPVIFKNVEVMTVILLFSKKENSVENIRVVSDDMEQYMALNTSDLVFIYSFQLMSRYMMF